MSQTNTVSSSEYFLSDDFLHLPIDLNFSELDEVKRKVCRKFEHIQIVVQKLIDIDNVSILFFSNFYNAMTEQYNKYCDILLVQYGISSDMYWFEFDYLFDENFSVKSCIENYFLFCTPFHKIVVVLFFMHNILQQLRDIKNRRRSLLSRPEE